MLEVVVSVTKKGQITIPKKLRQKYGIKDKPAHIEDNEKGLLLKPLLSPRDEFGSLKHLYPGKTAKEVIEEGLKQDYERDRRLLKLSENADCPLE